MTLRLWHFGNVTMLKIDDETGQSINVDTISRIFYKPIGTTIELKSGKCIEVPEKYETVVSALSGQQ